MSKIEENIKKGIEGEDFVEKSIQKFFNAETDRQKGFDDKGIDIYCHFQHPFYKTRISFGIQVKTGSSHVLDLEKRWKININKDKFQKAKKSNIPIMIVWVNDITNTAYWSFLFPNSTFDNIYISKKHHLSPITFYNFIVKLKQYEQVINNGIIKFDKKISLIKHRRITDLGNIINYAKNFYKNTLLGKIINNPIIGDIKITNSAWKNITRIGRRARYITSSIEMLSATITALKYATIIKHYDRRKQTSQGNWNNAYNIIVLQIDNIIFEDRAPASIHVHIKEIIKYHKNYANPINTTKKEHLSRELIFDNIFEYVKKEATKLPPVNSID